MAISSTPTDYSNLCTGRLAQKISTTTSTGFIVTADTFTTPAGTSAATWPTGNQIWKISRKTRTTSEVEFIGVESASQSGSTVTTGTVIRYLPANGSSLTSQGNGLSFPAGTVVELVWHAYTAEQTMFKDSVNTITGAGAIRGSSTTVAAFRPNSVTTAQRDLISAANGDIVYNSTTNQINTYEGGAWGATSSTTVADGSTTVAGKFEEATVAEQGTATATGATGARLVPAVANLVKTSSGAGDENKIPLLQSDGALHINHIATGTPDGTKFVRDDGTLQTPTSVDVRAGDGADGALNVTSGTTTIDLAGANLVEKNYTSINVSNGATLDFSNPAADGTIIIFRSQGNVTFAGTVTGTNLGSTGGASGGVASGVAVVGIAGTNSYNSFGQTRSGAGGDANTNSSNARATGGAGGASTSTGGSNSTASAPAAAATGGTALTLGAVAVGLTGVILSPGAGGGSGGAASSTTAGSTATATGGAGGRGAGALLVICGGNYTDAGGTINFAGTAGSTGTKVDGSTQFSNAGAGGGGGSGGSYCALVSGTINSSGTRTVTGGTAGASVSSGAGGNSGATGAAGAGGAGLALVIPII